MFIRALALSLAALLVAGGVAAADKTPSPRAAPPGRIVIVSNFPQMRGPQYILEAYPDRILASRNQYEAALRSAAATVSAKRVDLPQYVIVEAARRWSPDRIMRVAFRGGNDALYMRIESAAMEWITVGGANLKLEFRDRHGRFLTWAPTDVVYSGDIRIAFASGPDDGGYWSHVGTSSTNPLIEGGKPGQASMNFDSFDQKLPGDWKAIVIHEFGHALGFEHEHQNPMQGCDFRFDDDPGYVLETDDGYVVANANGKRPGLYSYLGGRANFWKPEKVNFNLRALTNTSAFAVGPFDRFSVMKYFFDPSMFFAGRNSPCYTERDANQSISQQDIRGIQRVYPKSIWELDALNRSSNEVAFALRDVPGVSGMVLGPVQSRIRANPQLR
jgi:hypothetical protein